MTVYASFTLKEHRFEAYIPDSDEEPHRFTLVITLGDKEIRREYIPMHYPCLFGVDVADIADLEERTEEIIRELGLE
jgi:hypothetical protein